MATLNININIHHHGDATTDKKLDLILNHQTNIMSTLTDLEAKVDAQSAQITELQTSLDTEQQQIADAIGALNTTIATNTQTIADLQQQLADLGASQEIIDRVTTKLAANNDALTSIKTDLEGTIA